MSGQPGNSSTVSGVSDGDLYADLSDGQSVPLAVYQKQKAMFEALGVRVVGEWVKTPVSDPLRDLASYAADVRWDELANGAEFTLIDRYMLRELHTRGRIALAVLSNVAAQRVRAVA